MTDFERKLYQIFVNMSLYGKNPTLPELKRKTGKGEQEIREATKALSEKERFLGIKKRKDGLYKKPFSDEKGCIRYLLVFLLIAYKFRPVSLQHEHSSPHN